MALPLRTRAAVVAGNVAAGTSRLLGLGRGSSVGGKVMLALEPHALELAARGHRIALVSGTNGKTTTTRLLAAALATSGAVTTNAEGANLLAGLAATVAVAQPASLGALEVDEGVVPAAIATIRPEAVVLLNLSRDQLDRIGEVRLHAEKWQRALTGPIPHSGYPIRVIANADDPLVVFAARGAEEVVWVGTGQRWRSDAAACPVCGGRIEWDEGSTQGEQARGGSQWACGKCGFARPEPSVWLDADNVVLTDGRSLGLGLQLPGWCNRANAAMALGGAMAMGIDAAPALEAMATVGTVAGRYETVAVGGTKVRLLLAKNPAGWAEMLDLIRPAPLPVVIGINARIADGRDPSWLWDVPFEVLRGRLVVATGDRGRDLAVRLRYAEVEHRFVDGYRDAAAATGADDIDLAANYTSFQDARKELARGR